MKKVPIVIILLILSQVYKEKLCKFAYSRDANARKMFSKLRHKTSYLKKDDILPSTGNPEEFHVPSENDNHRFYLVNRETGICECVDSSIKGNFCKHLYAVCLHFNLPSKGMPPVTANDRYLIAYIAMGDKAPSKEFFSPLHKDTIGTKS